MDQMMRHLYTIATLGCAFAGPALAQSAAPLTGRVVRTGSNTPIPGAEVTLDPRGTRSTTDANGEFRFESVPSGFVMIFVRRIGFLPESLGVNLPLATAIDIELRETAQQLDTVNVAARANTIPRGKLADFYERKEFGIGRFLEAKDFENLQNRQLADVLSARLPGIRKIRLIGGSGVAIGTSRLIPRALRGGPPQPCYAEIYLDGAAVFTDGSSAPFDVNTLDAAHIAAVEFYSGPAQTPARFNKTGSGCGVLLIWTK